MLVLDAPSAPGADLPDGWPAVRMLGDSNSSLFYGAWIVGLAPGAGIVVALACAGFCFAFNAR